MSAAVWHARCTDRRGLLQEGLHSPADIWLPAKSCRAVVSVRSGRLYRGVVRIVRIVTEGR